MQGCFDVAGLETKISKSKEPHNTEFVNILVVLMYYYIHIEKVQNYHKKSDARQAITVIILVVVRFCTSGGDSHIKVTGVLVRFFESDP